MSRDATGAGGRGGGQGQKELCKAAVWGSVSLGLIHTRALRSTNHGVELPALERRELVFLYPRSVSHWLRAVPGRV